MFLPTATLLNRFIQEFHPSAVAPSFDSMIGGTVCYRGHSTRTALRIARFFSHLSLPLLASYVPVVVAPTGATSALPESAVTSLLGGLLSLPLHLKRLSLTWLQRPPQVEHVCPRLYRPTGGVAFFSSPCFLFLFDGSFSFCFQASFFVLLAATADSPPGILSIVEDWARSPAMLL